MKLASYLCYIFINTRKTTLVQVQVQEFTNADKSTRIPQMWDQQPFTKNALFVDIRQGSTDWLQLHFEDNSNTPMIYYISLASFMMVNNYTRQTGLLKLASYLCWLFYVWKYEMTENKINSKIMRKEVENEVVSYISVFILKHNDQI